MFVNEVKLISERINPLLKEKLFVIIAIDGMTGSGKTVLASELQQIYHGALFHADDFFLPPELRTKKRFDEPGGNIHYERMKKEIIDKLKTAKIDDEISYKPFICKTQSYGNDLVQKIGKVNIVEGSYCLNPKFGKYYDISIVLKINEKIQIDRLTKRCPQMINNFINKWIPLEKKYHEAFNIFDNADITFDY